MKVIICAITNDCNPHIFDMNENFLPFSLGYFTQCYKRISQDRKDHPTLNSTSKNLLNVFGIFVSNFYNIDFNSLKEEHEFDLILKLPFVKKEFEVKNENLIKSFNNYCFDINNDENSKLLQYNLDSYLASKEYTYVEDFDNLSICTSKYIKELVQYYEFKEDVKVTNLNSEIKIEKNDVLNEKISKIIPPKSNVRLSNISLNI